MKRIPLTLAVCAAVILTTVGAGARKTNTTRPKLKTEDPVGIAPSETCDTVHRDLTALVFSGYEKTQSATKESIFLTNVSDRDIVSVSLIFEYVDLSDRQLHQRTVDIDVDIPVNETRQVYFKSWDTQHLWYYELTQGKHNAYCSPYNIKIGVNYVVYEKKSL